MQMRQTSSKRGNTGSRKSPAAPKRTMPVSWIILTLFVYIQPIPIIQAAVYRLRENDPCLTKGVVGICKTWGDCPIIKTLIEQKEYSTKTVERCAFTIHEELICCPPRMSEAYSEKSTTSLNIKSNPLIVFPSENSIQEHDHCQTQGKPGICKTWGDCSIIGTLIAKNEYSTTSVDRCGFSINDELICCPSMDNEEINEDVTIEANTEGTTQITTENPKPEPTNIEIQGYIDDVFGVGIEKPGSVTPADNQLNYVTPRVETSTRQYDDRNLDLENNTTREISSTLKPFGRNDRPAVRACNRILRQRRTPLGDHILGGRLAKLGEFPHMVALVFNLGSEVRCGGSLIDERFVLTAAHCVARESDILDYVRMGVVNFEDDQEMREAVQIKVKQSYIHDKYSTRSSYNDIAILELEEPVKYNVSHPVYPACLHTDETDPLTDVKLSTSGWGRFNKTSSELSKILLTAQLDITPMDKCNADFVKYGLKSHIRDGVLGTQLCAEDKQRIRDACLGDSGGPLHFNMNETLNIYKVVGVVSMSEGCADAVPGVYTRVTSFLDFIEPIVWPNGGD